MPNTSPQSFSWLHLSELRLGAPVQRTQWAVLQQPLRQDLERLQTRLGLRPDCVCISGGLTEYGTPDGFDALQRFMDTALRPLLAPATPIFVVPGPSDASRVERVGFGLLALRGWFAQPDLPLLFFGGEPADRKPVTDAFAGFAGLQERLAATPSAWERQASPLVLPGDFRAMSLTHGVQILGLNSAFLQPVLQDATALGASAGSLGFDLHPSQLRAFADLGDPARLLGLLLTYHGPQALHASSRATYYNALNPSADVRRFLLHLCAAPAGERPRIEMLRSGNQLDGLIYSGRGFCDPRRSTDPEAGYCLGRLRRGAEQVEVALWPRRFHAPVGKFLADQDFEDLDGDQISLTLACRGLRQIGESSSDEREHPDAKVSSASQSGRRAASAAAPPPSSHGHLSAAAIAGPTQGSSPQTAQTYSRPEVRRLLEGVLRTDSDLMAFLLDYFPEVYRRLSSGMDRTSKHNLLLQIVDSSQIVATLQRHDARAFERERRAIASE